MEKVYFPHEVEERTDDIKIYASECLKPYDILEHHGIKGQKWGVRNGPPYPLESSSMSKKIFDDASERVDRISNDVMKAATNAGSTMYGLENRLKTEESISRKIDKNAKEKDISLLESANDIKDAIRFTTITSDNDFVFSYKKMKSELEDMGYKETRCKNYFDLFSQGKVKHKSVQSTFADKDGYEFEIQFHTPASQDVKDKKIPIYEERRQVDISPERAKELERAMVNLALQVPDPINIDKIKSH